MDYRIIRPDGSVISYLVNAESESIAKEFVKDSIEENHELIPVGPLGVPGMFNCCIMDEETIESTHKIKSP